MSVNYVKVYYGPHESFYTVCHRPQKLQGLKACRVPNVVKLKTILMVHTEHLQKLGFRVDLVPVEFINCCVLEMCGHEVFRCNIKNLSFNTSCDRDPVCRRAVAAVQDSSVKFRRARSYMWSWASVDEQIFRRSEYSPKDYWPFEFESSNTCDDCVICCTKK